MGKKGVLGGNSRPPEKEGGENRPWQERAGERVPIKKEKNKSLLAPGKGILGVALKPRGEGKQGAR